MTRLQALSPTAAVEEPTAAEIEALLALGLPNRWHPVLPSRLVERGTVVGIRRLGAPLVLWRDHGGEVHVQMDRCPHRGAPLSLGVNCGDRLRCAYHGIEVAGDGTVLNVPGQPGCPLEGSKAVKVFPAREVKGAIFAYFGDALHPEPVAYEPPEQLRDDGPYEAFLCYAEWAAPWRYAYDNNMDPMHGTFLHAKSHSMSRGDQEARFRNRPTPSGFVFEKEAQRDTNFDWSEWVDAGAIYCRLEIPYPPSGGPGGNFGIIFHGTPIDQHSMAGFYWRFRKVAGWQRSVWRFLFRNRLEARHWHVLEQDRRLLEAIEPDAASRENLYQHDTGLARVRHLLVEEARSQLRALKAAAKAKAGE